MYNIVIQEKNGPRRVEAFDQNEVTIGRVQGNDIVLPKGNISKRHSRIVLRDGKFIIVDLKSTNGTSVIPPNGHWRRLRAPEPDRTGRAGDERHEGPALDLGLQPDPAGRSVVNLDDVAQQLQCRVVPRGRGLEHGPAQPQPS